MPVNKLAFYLLRTAEQYLLLLVVLCVCPVFLLVILPLKRKGHYNMQTNIIFK